MAIHISETKNRRALTVGSPAVSEALPDWFTEDNDKLITLLDKYYRYIDDSSGDHSFGTAIRDLHHVRDAQAVDEKYLDEIIREIGNGLQASSFFQKPRLMTKLLAEFYRVKGSLVSVEGFFRGFFGQEVTIEYPKEKIFIVSESQIGYDSQRFIIDNGIYQTFSILVKIGLSVQDYELLYKKFVHPAGFHFAGEVLAETEALMGTQANTGVDSDEIRGIDDLGVILVSTASTATSAPVTPMTFLFDSSDGTRVRAASNQTVATYASDASITVEMLEQYYDNITQIFTPNSFTFDDSEAISPRTCMTMETMDNDMFTRYSSNILDSSI